MTDRCPAERLPAAALLLWLPWAPSALGQEGNALGWLIEHQRAVGLFSLTSFLLSLITLPALVAFLPRDYFTKRAQGGGQRRASVLRIAAALIKNLVGVCLLLAGLAMLVLPGQGLLTILLGLTLTSFPGKQRLERRLLEKPKVRRGLDKIRSLARRPPFEWPGRGGAESAS
ncbi:MAG: PGPGW domain-containing protein [Acidobacteriota bacterium]